MLFFLSQAAWAEPVRSPLYLHFAGKGSYGQAYSKNKSIPSRVMLVPAVEAALAWRFSALLLGLSGEYALWQQHTDPKNTSDSNLQGTMFTLVPVLGLDFGPVRFLAKYFPLAGKYSLSRPNLAGEVQAYTSPAQLALQLHFRLAGSSFFGLEYSSVEYDSRESNGVAAALAAGSEAEFKSMGVIYGFAF